MSNQPTNQPTNPLYSRVKWFLSRLGLLVAALAVAIAVSHVFAWTNPSLPPPGGTPPGIVPSGAVMFFNLSGCPSGWSEIVSARGRYLVGLPSGGTLTGTAGTALSNLENRPAGAHTHYPWPRGTGGTGYWGKFPNDNSGGYEPGPGIYESGGNVAGTNAPYIQYLICQKD